jgi:hypothetical protein
LQAILNHCTRQFKPVEKNRGGKRRVREDSLLERITAVAEERRLSQSTLGFGNNSPTATNGETTATFITTSSTTPTLSSRSSASAMNLPNCGGPSRHSKTNFWPAKGAFSPHGDHERENPRTPPRIRRAHPPDRPRRGRKGQGLGRTRAPAPGGRKARTNHIGPKTSVKDRQIRGSLENCCASASVKFQQRYQMRNRILSKAVPGLELCPFCNSQNCVPLVRQFLGV